MIDFIIIFLNFYKMESKENQIKKLQENIANDQKELKIMKDQLVVYKILDEFKEQLGDELENIVLDYFQFDLKDENISDSDSDGDVDEEMEALKLLIKPEPKYSKYELNFYVKYAPKPGREYKYGAKGIRHRARAATHPYSFQDFSWLTKKRLYRSFKTLGSAISYANAVWEKYPTDIVFEN